MGMGSRCRTLDGWAASVAAGLRNTTRHLGGDTGNLATRDEIVALWHAQGGRCALTLAPMSLDSSRFTGLIPTLDHIWPRSRGGRDRIENLQIVEWWLNQGKSNMD